MRRTAVLILCLILLLGAATASASSRAAPLAQEDDPVLQFRIHCASCHGADGAGSGWARGNLYPPPSNLADDVFKMHSTPAGALPTDDDILRVLRRGVPGTSMPGFANSLSPELLRALVAYVKTLSPRFARETAPEPYPIPSAPLSGPVGIENGGKHYLRLGCDKCHGPDGRAQIDGARDLSATWAFKHGREPEGIYLSIAQGFDGTAMKGYADTTTEGERWELMFFVRSLARPAMWVQTDPVRIRALPLGNQVDETRRGAYLVRALGCGRCHTPFNPDGTFVAERALSGGTRIEAWPYGIFYAPNLTSDPVTGLGGYSTEDIVGMLTGGQKGLLGLNRLNPLVMPWPYYARLEPGDARSMALYLQSLPPVYNAVPAADGYGFANTLAGKFSAVVLNAPAVVTMYPGNAGNPEPGAVPAEASLEHRLAPAFGLGAALVGGLVIWGVLALLPVLRVSPRGRRKAELIIIPVYVLIVLLLGALYLSPLYAYLPGSAAASFAVKMPAPEGLTDPAQMALAERGQYVATIAACGTCHSPVPSGLFAGAPPPLTGGLEVRWAAFGTRYSGNLTPDATGLQNWTSDDLKYAFQSGQARDGLALHWQAMPWDFYSNFTDEDAQALAVYLLSLPPQAHTVPLLVPPAADDPLEKVIKYRP